MPNHQRRRKKAEHRAEEEAQKAQEEARRADKAEQSMAEMKAEMIVTILEKRGISVDDVVRRRILDCREDAELDRIMERSWSLDSALDLFLTD